MLSFGGGSALICLLLVSLALLLALPGSGSPPPRARMPAYVPLSKGYPQHTLQLQVEGADLLPPAADLLPPRPRRGRRRRRERLHSVPSDGDMIVEEPRPPQPLLLNRSAAVAAASSDLLPPLGPVAARTRAAAAAQALEQAYPQLATPQDAPWLFSGGTGRPTRRAGEQLQMRKNSGFMGRDSPPLPPPGGALTLTGTAWHHGGAAAAERCAARGVWSAALQRCDCGPFAWGADCSVAVVTQTICVMNDSKPWFCDKPACVSRADERVSAGGEFGARSAEALQAKVRCVGEPLQNCPGGCSGRGACRGRTCACYDGYTGPSCAGVDATAARCMGGCSGRGACERGFCRCRPPYWGTDCAMGGGAASEPRCTRRPCIYVYELPARMNVMALKTEHDWREQWEGKKFDYRMPLAFHEAVLSSAHRTSRADEADFFYVPTWDWHGSWGNPEVYYRAHRYLSSAWPYWNASGGADHLWAVARDAAACATPWGSLLDELRPSKVLSNWGGVTGLSGREEERCFAPGTDLVLPGTLTSSTVQRSPWLLDETALRAQLSPTRRPTRLYFFGALCWKTETKTSSLPELERKCRTSYEQAGFLSRYSFGLRYEIFKKHRDAVGFQIFATDYVPSMRGGRRDVNADILASQFCLCPSGTGWGMRVFHVMILGCVPVLVQHDGVHPHVQQAFEPELLDWSEFAVKVQRDQVDTLPALLASVDLAAKQAALRRVWTRMVWRDTLKNATLRATLPGPDAFDSTMAALLAHAAPGSVKPISVAAGS